MIRAKTCALLVALLLVAQTRGCKFLEPAPYRAQAFLGVNFRSCIPSAHTRTHARTHARTHTHTRMLVLVLLLLLLVMNECLYVHTAYK